MEVRATPAGEVALRRRNRRNLAPLLIAPTMILMFVFFALPYANMLLVSFLTPGKTQAFAPPMTLQNYGKYVLDPYSWDVLLRTMLFGVGATVVCLVLGFPVAYHLTRTRTRYKGLLFSCVLSPLLVGVVIRSYGWMILLADHGLINESLMKAGLISHSLPLMYNGFGVMVALVHVFLPFMVLSLSGSIQTINPDLEAMAQSLGASRLRAFFDVVFPLSLPGVLSGSILVFVMTVSSYVLPILVGGFRVIITPMLVVQQVIELFNWPGGAALAIILFVSSLIVIVTFMRVMNRAMRGIA